MSDPTLDLDAIEARLNAATPGPWDSLMDSDTKAAARDWREVWGGPASVVVGDFYERRSGGETETVCGVRIRAANATLIANAPTDLRALVAEVRRLTDANARLTDLVRHQRGPLLDASLITDAEYADLAGISGSPARLEGYDALRGELERTKRALNVATRERDEARAAHLDLAVNNVASREW
jgi:hypothetical protein